uniref:Large ribosomal subunit protein uL16c n=1 Tax=Bulboplastis apyrenoidosa TaxID=1070855 RepID=A0A1Y9TM94_9RHOD|nr:50S ribosomal protein L16 [Bulboplastis apyrenoidosa]ARO90777.1 50S ribosomal protein L16 [Bulboplastis apyrenoidosa]
MLSPKRTKFRKHHRGRLKGVATRGNKVSFGDYGLKSLEPVWLNSRQIEAARRTITRYVRRDGKLWIRVFPDKSVTARAAETRMGSGKGMVEYWVAVIKPGHVIFEMSGISREIAYNAMKMAAYKLPVKTKFITKQE